jgi:hypothetical protein
MPLQIYMVNFEQSELYVFAVSRVGGMYPAYRVGDGRFADDMLVCFAYIEKGRCEWRFLNEIPLKLVEAFVVHLLF